MTFHNERCYEPPAPVTAICKHKSGNCEKCGTTNRRDVHHTTKGGRGKVGELVARSKKKK